MKSFIRSLVDYRTLPMDWHAPIACPEDHIQKELRQVVRKHKTFEPVSALQAGDIAVLKLSSALPKFQRESVPVTVDSHLLDPELEGACVGRGPGDRFSVEIDRTRVDVVVLQAARTRYPEPTDTMVAAFCGSSGEYAGIKTVKDFVGRIRSAYCAQKREEAVYERMELLLNGVLAQSDWDFSDEDLRCLREQALEELQVSLRRQGEKPLEALSEAELWELLGVSGPEALEEELRAGNERWIATVLFCAAQQGRKPDLADRRSLNFDFLERYVRAHILYEEETV